MNRRRLPRRSRALSAIAQSATAQAANSTNTDGIANFMCDLLDWS